MFLEVGLSFVWGYLYILFVVCHKFVRDKSSLNVKSSTVDSTNVNSPNVKPSLPNVNFPHFNYSEMSKITVSLLHALLAISCYGSIHEYRYVWISYYLYDTAINLWVHGAQMKIYLPHHLLCLIGFTYITDSSLNNDMNICFFLGEISNIPLYLGNMLDLHNKKRGVLYMRIVEIIFYITFRLIGFMSTIQHCIQIGDTLAISCVITLWLASIIWVIVRIKTLGNVENFKLLW